MDLSPQFIEPPVVEAPVRQIRPQDQAEFDTCGTCPDCRNMLALGYVEEKP